MSNPRDTGDAREVDSVGSLYEDDERCVSGQDGIHCRCWFDGDACCSCFAPEMTDEAKREQGMDV